MDIDSEEYERHLENLREAEVDSGERLGYGFGSQYLSDEMKYTDGIIRYEPNNELDAYLCTLFLKKRTTSKLKRLILNTTSLDKVLNNFERNDVRKENLGEQMLEIALRVNMSGIEEEANDGHFEILSAEITHRTRVTRGREGFERKVQKTNIVKSTARSVLGSERQDPPKTGISRYTQGRRQ